MEDCFVNDELERISKEEIGACFNFLFTFINIYFHTVRETTKSLCYNREHHGRDLNPRSPKYEAEVLITQAQRLVRAYDGLIPHPGSPTGSQNKYLENT
jgi:hypothetical protein